MGDVREPRKIAVVTGALGGIGRGCVAALSKRGFDVVACDLAQDDSLDNDLKARTAAGGRIAFVSGDLAELNHLPRFVEAIFDAFGRVDCLVNNAGVSVISRGDLLDVSVESFDLNFNVNARGTFFLTQAVSRRMLGAPGDFRESSRSIVFISSPNAAIAAPERGEYAMSKGPSP